MSRITVDRDSSYAPCCYLLCQVDDTGNWDTRDEDTTRLIDTDWDYPGIASVFGWNIADDDCEHEGTDGTVDCPSCGKTAGEFISEASDYLDANLGTIVDDPGYFD